MLYATEISRAADLWESMTEDMMARMLAAVGAWAVWLSNKDMLWTALILGLISCSCFTFRNWLDAMGLPSGR